MDKFLKWLLESVTLQPSSISTFASGPGRLTPSSSRHMFPRCYGPMPLIRESVNLVLPQPGVYVLGKQRNSRIDPIYVGRSDTNLQERLEQHLPEYETNLCLLISMSDSFYVWYCRTDKEAYELECFVYHALLWVGIDTLCNREHPKRNAISWRCPWTLCRF
jgi:hypothetical protein